MVCMLGSSPLTRGKRDATSIARDQLGSSPLTRGKLKAQCCQVIVIGLIPARAGKTPAQPGRATWFAAHPRSRGENVMIWSHRLRASGSSPLARGKQHNRSIALTSQRLIPARAGKTRSAITASPQRRAHPRSRGENLRLHGCAQEIVGSSPLARGKLENVTILLPSPGLIPARAGKTLYR